ncbi:MAG TPA: FtsX-like permease family protein [Steroidobacteraceae bacterium]|nr:FtsX-like permease family protein [Steroidobacteraceae bacterium]
MEIRPILSALLRNRTGAVLVGLQVAITLAVIANAFFIIERRLEKINRPTGIATPDLIFASSEGYTPDYQHVATLDGDLALLKGIPGVLAVTPINSVPLSGGGSANVYQTSPDPKAPLIPGNYFEVNADFVDALGLKLLAGRSFRPGEFVAAPANNDLPSLVVVSATMAKKLFGDVPAVGRRVYDNAGKSAEVIGVVSDMQGSWIDNTRPGSYDIVFHPQGGLGKYWDYAIRVRPGERDRMIPVIEQALNGHGHGRAIHWVRPHEYWLTRTFRADRRMVVFLTTLVVLMTAVTALGIVGLATFHVNSRQKQIGTRRALGARRADIVRYFMVENGLLGVTGAAVGVLLAYAASGWLTRAFELPPLPLGYVAASAVALVALGQAAVLWPARRAGAIDPAVATRTV